MNTGSSYRFHRFDEFNTQPLPYQPFPDFQQSQSLNFTSNSFQSAPLYEENEMSSRFISELPVDEILNTDILKEINSNNTENLEELLEKMTHKNYMNENNFPLTYLISTFQVLLDFLKSTRDNLEAENLHLEMYNKNRESLKEETKEREKVLQSQGDLIKNLKARVEKYKTVVNLHKHMLKPKTRIYFCDVCPNAKFTNYESFHKHYVKRHIDPNKADTFYSFHHNRGFDQVYFDQEISNMENELKDTFIAINERKNKIFTERYQELMNSLDNTTPFSGRKDKKRNRTYRITSVNRVKNPLTRSRAERSADEIKQAVLELKKSQQQKYGMMVKELDDFKAEMYRQLSNIAKMNQDKKFKKI